MHLALVLALAVGSIQGVATTDGALLPGCTVTLSSEAGQQKMYTDAEGRYRFPAVEPGWYELLFELDGLESVERSIEVVEGLNEQPPADLPWDQTRVVTLSCGRPPCNDGAPETAWDWPSCTDYELDEALIESMKRGDQSAAALLRDRFSRAFTYAQKHRIAAAMLRQVPDDRVFWDELFEHARNCVRFDTGGEHSAEYLQWCAGHGYDPDQYDRMSMSALFLIAGDRRSHTLLIEGLERGVPDLLDAATWGFGTQRDLTVLPAIERALDRFRETGGNLEPRLYGLALYGHEEADRVAFKYLDDEQRQEYLKVRNEPLP